MTTTIRKLEKYLSSKYPNVLEVRTSHLAWARPHLKTSSNLFVIDQTPLWLEAYLTPLAIKGLERAMMDVQKDWELQQSKQAAAHDRVRDMLDGYLKDHNAD